MYAYRKAEKLPITVGVSPDVLDLSDYKGAEVQITWTLVTEGFFFPKDNTGIVFTSPGADRGVLSVKTVTEGPLAYRAVVAIAAPTGLAYAYTVSVIEESTGLLAVVDPTSIHPPP